MNVRPRPKALERSRAREQSRATGPVESGDATAKGTNNPLVSTATGEIDPNPNNLTGPSDDFESINQSIQPYSKPIAIALTLVTAAAIGFVLIRSNQTADRSDATLRLLQAVGEGDEAELANVSKLHPDTVAGAWAKVFRGDQLLGGGLNDFYQNAEIATDGLKEAKSAYQSALSETSDPLIASRAHLGLAKVAESMGEFEEAASQYGKVVETAESDELRQYAESRMESIDNPSNQAFLTWFAAQEFAPEGPSMPPAMPDLGVLPSMPDIDFGDLGGDDAASDDAANADSTTADDNADAATPMEENASSEFSLPAEPAESGEPAEADETAESSEPNKPAGSNESAEGDAAESGGDTPDE